MTTTPSPTSPAAEFLANVHQDLFDMLHYSAIEVLKEGVNNPCPPAIVHGVWFDVIAAWQDGRDQADQDIQWDAFASTFAWVSTDSDGGF